MDPFRSGFIYFFLLSSLCINHRVVMLFKINTDNFLSLCTAISWKPFPNVVIFPYTSYLWCRPSISWKSFPNVVIFPYLYQLSMMQTAWCEICALVLHNKIWCIWQLHGLFITLLSHLEAFIKGYESIICNIGVKDSNQTH